MKVYRATSTILFLVLGLMPPISTHAQNISAKGITPEVSFKTCEKNALKLEERAVSLKRRINLILNCNNQGQVFDVNAKSCVTPGLSPDHIFAEYPTGDTLALKNPDASTGEPAHIGGRNGTSVTCVEQKQDCLAPWGVSVPHKWGVIAYKNDGVPHGEACEQEARTCQDGHLTGSYSYETCKVGNPPPPKACSAPWGAVVSGGKSIVAYKTTSVGSGQTCMSESRHCNNGVLSGSYTYQNCTPEPEEPTEPTCDMAAAIACANQVSNGSNCGVSPACQSAVAGCYAAHHCNGCPPFCAGPRRP